MSEPKRGTLPPFVSKRLTLIFVMVFLFFASLILRLSFVQLVEGEKYLEVSAVNNTKKLNVPAPRGMIFDRHHIPLIWNKPAYTVNYLPPEGKTNEKVVANQLAEILGMEPNAVLERIQYPQPKYIPRRIKVGITKEQMFQIAERRKDLPGVEVVVESVRQIRGSETEPTGTYLLGYVNSIPVNLVKEYMSKGYRPTDKIGVSGLEKAYEQELRGRDGSYQVTVNKNAETIDKYLSAAPVPGHDLVLTIDWRFQEKVENILKDEVTRIHQHNPAVTEAIAVAMKPKTGEILALAGYPNYDLNLHYSDYFGKIYNEKIKGKELNRITNSAYPIGSTMKPLSVMLGIDQHLVTPDERLTCEGSLRIGDREIFCWKKTGHGALTAKQALKYSCNVYMYKLAMKLAEYPQKPREYLEKFEVLDYYFEQFGLGTKTGIDLPGESTGWKTDTFYLGNLAYALIGQYNAYTPMQLVQYIATIANDGYRMRPFLVKEIRSSNLESEENQSLLTQRYPEVINRVDIPLEVIHIVQDGMKKVTEPGGTAYYTFKDFVIPVAAKTGTAQTGTENDNSLIAGYAPSNNPEIAFVVIVPKGGSGSDTSGPISRKILEAFFQVES
ncbi:peptidoglycan D,D-transpeptidase FtsI family protein [Ammoniphilus resinae]|uniref:Penicillin-binding protein 2 n=1 Tax=Ammoniphilus resinae TaxID=861532 RepID=A0ABS4GJL2_9BACL|nr:penicillin-binding transpeptidase domain-containing protein [Ammoniphilus resinae]MBP1930409.1 penicillin-binding protein 2 [Ammoniphilus resinae]